MKEEVITANALQTQELGEKFAGNLKAGDIVVLRGNLGSGKTTFVQGVAKAFGITTRIISPTFILVRQHKIHDQAVHILYHIDLYRLSDANDTNCIGLEEILADQNAVTLIEWPEKLGSLLPKQRWDITFLHGNGDNRTITVKTMVQDESS